MKTLFVIWIALCLQQAATGIPFPPARQNSIEGTIVAYVWMSSMQFEEATKGRMSAAKVSARYYMRIKAPEIDKEHGDYLTFCARGVAIRHNILSKDLEKHEIIVVVPSEHLKNLKVGAKITIKGYEAFRDDGGCVTKCKAILIDDKQPTPSGGAIEARPKTGATTRPNKTLVGSATLRLLSRSARE